LVFQNSHQDHSLLGKKTTHGFEKGKEDNKEHSNQAHKKTISRQKQQ
jgi:hypothetical protein